MNRSALGIEGDARRASVIREVSRMLAAAAQDRRTLLLSVLGDAGHGKSHLAVAAERELELEQIPTIRVSGSPETMAIPYAAIYDMLVNTEPYRASRALLDDLSSFHATAAPLAVSSALTQWMHDRSRGEPLILMVDDADLLDEDSLRVISFAAVRAHAPLSVLHTATRPVRLLERLLVQQFLLEDLDEDSALALSRGAGAAGGLAHRLVDSYGGNPLALLHGSTGPAPPDARSIPGLPDRLLDDVQQRLDPQPSEAVRLLEAAAVTGVSDATDLARMVACAPGSLDELTDEIERSGIAVIDGPTLWWRRRWMRAAVAQRCPANRSRRWRQRAAGASVPHARPGPPGADLTTAERRVVEVIVTGSSNQEAARALHLSAKTVDAHLQSIYRKLEVHSRGQLAALHFSGGLGPEGARLG